MNGCATRTHHTDASHVHTHWEGLGAILVHQYAVLGEGLLVDVGVRLPGEVLHSRHIPH